MNKKQYFWITVLGQGFNRGEKNTSIQKKSIHFFGSRVQQLQVSRKNDCLSAIVDHGT